MVKEVKSVLKAVCGLNGCRSYHHRMLHEDRAEVKTPQNDSTARSDPPPTCLSGSAEEGEDSQRYGC